MNEKAEQGQIYKHFKGNYYYVENIAYDSVSNEGELKQVVIYRTLYGDNKLWTRPLDEFISLKENPNGTTVRRFKLIQLMETNIENRNI